MNKLDAQYQQLLLEILKSGVEKKDRTGTGTISLFGKQIRHKMGEGFPLLTTKKMYWKGIVTELLWFLKGDTNIKFLVDNDCHIWDGDAFKNYCTTKENWTTNKEGNAVLLRASTAGHYGFLSKEEFINKIKTDDEFAKQWGDLGPVYGAQWRKWDGIDQIEELITTLKINPDSRRMLVSAWNVNYLDEMTLPPCHYGFQVYTRELNHKERFNYYTRNSNTGLSEINFTPPQLDELNVPTRAISLMWNQRSVDTFLGLPFNIASYGLLLEIIAKTVNMVPDELIGNLGDVHLYKNHIEQAKEQIDRTPYELPKLNINTEFWSYEGGECGEGPLDAIAVFNSFKDENFCKCLLEEDIQLYNYQSHPAIKAELSN